MSALTPYLPGLIAAWAIHLTGALSPGPSVALILGHATARGRGAALLCSVGIATGSALLALATALGLSVLVAEAGHAMQVIRWIGAAYLAWLSYGAFRKAMRPAPVPAAASPQAARRTFWGGFLLQVSNPKALIFWIAIAAVAPTAGGPAWLIAFFVGMAFVISFAAHGGWALLLSSGPARAAYTRARRWIEAGLGMVFGAAALKLALERN